MSDKDLLHTGTVDTTKVLKDVWCVRTLMVNTVFVGGPDQGDWVLVDTGLGPFKEALIQEADAIYGRPPKAIILTHGHFDHVGCVIELSDYWKVPVYAHVEEFPYLTGLRDYPEGDPSVGGGLLAGVAPIYPNRAINLEDRLEPLPEDGTVPGATGWKWIATPGHSPGHVSLYRQQDHTLIAGDAFITVKQESALAVMRQEKEIHGPPMYFTPDWETAKVSLCKLAELSPETAITGHGVPMTGEELRFGLHRLCEHFEEIAVPEQGRYVD
ncbi:glyoxylase-like metal-dependent hydrolase (beta-lactamase superfamily II) [Fontibacillus phaseoli]|uniref:Glyoxylase-like metal-dependent hydrolase (Beta-lactamase superfamily II) n=1 Tax=Fontibacillus phaseoli TaxID=1416533 RepID=A0A369BRS8_9BACL|nr:MBL fold metallo-hydrolase [Fontibacillus phaseoli]RCX23378.1 glyoxylase-like metal-dependent hydrolase (beta-lactamase superfamily II) [Fontibacillus phaseoli]